MVRFAGGALYRGDGLAIMRDIPAGSVDMLLSDLPYGITAAHRDKPLDLRLFWQCVWRVMKENGAVVLTATMKHAVDLIRE